MKEQPKMNVSEVTEEFNKNLMSLSLKMAENQKMLVGCIYLDAEGAGVLLSPASEKMREDLPEDVCRALHDGTLHATKQALLSFFFDKPAQNNS